MNFTQGNEPEEHSEGFSFHPDMGWATKEYGQWKRSAVELQRMSGRRIVDYSSSPYNEVAREHSIKSRRGERYWAGNEETDQYYIEKMRDKAVRHVVITGEKKPDTAPHPRYSEKRKGVIIYDGKNRR